jgi:hypothetical protein
MANTVEVTVVGTVQAVAATDIPESIVVTLEGQTNVTLPISGPYVATFSNVADGTYNGTVQSARADGSLIGTAIAYTVTALNAFVPASVTVNVTSA